VPDGELYSRVVGELEEVGFGDVSVNGVVLVSRDFVEVLSVRISPLTPLSTVNGLVVLSRIPFVIPDEISDDSVRVVPLGPTGVAVPTGVGSSRVVAVTIGGAVVVPTAGVGTSGVPTDGEIVPTGSAVSVGTGPSCTWVVPTGGEEIPGVSVVPVVRVFVFLISRADGAELGSCGVPCNGTPESILE